MEILLTYDNDRNHQERVTKISGVDTTISSQRIRHKKLLCVDFHLISNTAVRTRLLTLPSVEASSNIKSRAAGI